MAFCVNCGNGIEAEYEYCPECGVKISDSVNEEWQNSSAKSFTRQFKRCSNCGEQMPEDAFYCFCCGQTFDEKQYDFEEIKERVSKMAGPNKIVVDTRVGVWKNKWIALLLCVFFGVFGIHRFYEGKKITGFLYLFTFGFFGIGVFFDIILLATKTNPYRVK